MRRRLLPCVLLLLAALPAAARADEDLPAALDLDGATVLASPGVPAALEAFLPGGRRPAPLRWPLPEGPLLVLCLPDQDALARAITDAFQLPVDREALGGGYRLFAWRDRDRPLVFLCAADPAALLAARALFEADAPAARSDPGQRSLDFRQPNEEAGLLVPAGEHAERPRYRLRALAPGAADGEDDAVAAAGGHANRLWLDAPPGCAMVGPTLRRDVARARALGVEPVLTRRVQDPARVAEEIVPALLAGQGVGDVHCFALLFQRPDLPAEAEAACVRAVAAALRPGGLEELVVVPARYSDRLVEAFGPPPDLRDVPEAWIAWSGPSEHSLAIPREAARRRVRAAGGVPVLLYETWAAPFQGPDAAGHAPRPPAGRAADLGDLVDGIVVVGRKGSADALDGAWHAALPDRFGAELLGPLLPLGAPDAHAFLAQAAAALERTDRETLGLTRWMAPLAASVRTRAKEVAAGRPALTVPRVPEACVLDGRIDERPWAWARRIPTGREDLDVLALSDGTTLRLAVRVRRDGTTDGVGVVTLRLRVPECGVAHEIWLTDSGATLYQGGEGGSSRPEPGHVAVARRGAPGRWTAEVDLDRYALVGDARPTRCFDLEVVANGRRLWPPPDQETGLLVLVP